MTVDDTSGSVTVCSRGWSGLFADDLGVTERNFLGLPASGRRGFSSSGHRDLADRAIR